MEFDQSAATSKKRPRNRKFIYFNPPYSINVKTNIGARFLKLLDKHFPPGSPLYPILNRKKVKLSYRCLPNFKTFISRHNSKLLNQAETITPAERCNCNDPSQCPLPNKCTITNIVYQATPKTDTTEENYVGLTAPSFKIRYGNHKQDFINPARMHATTLSTYMWKQKGEGKSPKIDWKVISRASPFSPITGLCNLCTTEKWNIIFKPKIATLNSRKELFAHCRHKEDQLLVKRKRKVKDKT